MKRSYLYSAAHIIFWLFFKIFYRLKVIGLNHIPKKGPLILASNHASFLDPIVVGTAVTNRQIYYLARDTLFTNKIFGAIIRKVHSIPVKRGSADLGAFHSAQQVMEQGGAVLLFPEGTRTSDGNLQKAKRGMGIMALESRVPVVPVYVEGTFKALPRTRKMLKLSKIFVCFGEPITLESFYSMPSNKEAFQKISDAIMEKITLLKHNLNKTEKV